MSFLSEVQLDEKFGPFVAFQEALGFVPNLLHAQTLLPRVIEAQGKLEHAIRLKEQAISRIQKERILLCIAADRKDSYCIAVESKVLSSLGETQRQIDNLLNDFHQADLATPEVASLQFCLKLARHAPSVRPEDIQELRASGFDDRAIIEAIVLTALAVIAARCLLAWVRNRILGRANLSPRERIRVRSAPPRDSMSDLR